MKDIKKYFKSTKRKKFKYSKKRNIKKLKLNIVTEIVDNEYSNSKKQIGIINKSINKKFEKKNRIIFNLISLLLFIISYYFYYLSLEKCLQGDDACSKKWNWMVSKIIQLIISVVIIIFLEILIIYNLISRLHLFHFCFVFIYFYIYSHSFLFHDHGGYNLVGFFISLLISLILLLIIKIIIIIFKIKYKYKLISALVLLFFYNALVDPINCDDWALGLNNTYIQNDKNKYGCQIIFPDKCYYKVFSYTQDFNKFYRVTCSNKKKNARKRILKFSRSKYIDKNTTKFGFPLTNNEEGQKDGKDNIVLMKYTAHNLLDMDKILPSGFSKPEYIVDFSKDPLGILTVNLNYNESLSKIKKDLEKNSSPYSDNILMLYIDSISRANALRKLKKTIKFFEQFISYKGGYNKKYSTENFHSFQFFKYHAFEAYTVGNFPKLFYGNKRNAKDYVRITKYINQNGYVTCYSSDMCQKDATRTKHNLSKDALYDHQLLLCDPNMDSEWSTLKRCLYGNLNSYYLYDYVNQFWRKYKNNRKFALITMLDAHEGTLELIKYTDEIIYNLLNSLYNDNLLKDSSIFLLSDHGCAIPSVYTLYKFYQIEKRLPMLFMIVNDRKNVGYNQQYFNIQENQQTFITAYDIYDTIGNLIYGDNYTNIPNKDDNHDTPKSVRGRSLFDVINPKERRPKNYMYMSTDFCK